MLQFLKTLFKKELSKKYFAEFRINGKYRKIELSNKPKDNSIKAGIFLLKIESQRKEITKDNIEIVYECTYVTTKY